MLFGHPDVIKYKVREGVEKKGKKWSFFITFTYLQLHLEFGVLIIEFCIEGKICSGKSPSDHIFSLIDPVSIN